MQMLSRPKEFMRSCSSCSELHLLGCQPDLPGHKLDRWQQYFANNPQQFVQFLPDQNVRVQWVLWDRNPDQVCVHDMPLLPCMCTYVSVGLRNNPLACKRFQVASKQQWVSLYVVQPHAVLAMQNCTLTFCRIMVMNERVHTAIEHICMDAIGLCRLEEKTVAGKCPGEHQELL